MTSNQFKYLYGSWKCTLKNWLDLKLSPDEHVFHHHLRKQSRHRNESDVEKLSPKRQTGSARTFRHLHLAWQCSFSQKWDAGYEMKNFFDSLDHSEISTHQSQSVLPCQLLKSSSNFFQSYHFLDARSNKFFLQNIKISTANIPIFNRKNPN